MSAIGFDFTDLGLEEPAEDDGTPDPEAPVIPVQPARTYRTQDDLEPLTPGSILANVLYEVWRGRPVVIVPSPPGAGKSTLVEQIVEQLQLRTELSICVVTPTNRGGSEMAAKLGARLGKDANKVERVFVGSNNMTTPHGVASGPTHGLRRRQVEIRTISSASFRQPAVDILIVDEAYQATYADVCDAADSAVQVVLVGDPGQIGPVVTVNTDIFASAPLSPASRAPEVFATMQHVTAVTMPCTYRLGHDGAEALKPLYDFDFYSARPERWVADDDGTRMPELSHIQVAATGDPYHLDSAKAVAQSAVDYVGRHFTQVDENGVETGRPLTVKDVAIVVSHRAQKAAVEACLADFGDPYGQIIVGTADSLQGGQWPAVVAMDPLIGYENASDHSLSLGRLCVMASRHTASLTWLHDGQWAATLDAMARAGDVDAHAGKRVRRALTADTSRTVLIQRG